VWACPEVLSGLTAEPRRRHVAESLLATSMRGRWASSRCRRVATKDANGPQVPGSDSSMVEGSETTTGLIDVDRDGTDMNVGARLPFTLWWFVRRGRLAWCR
jgi:hypothetical protein